MIKEPVSCRYEPGMVCFHIGDCVFPSLTSCLQQNLYLAQKEISLLKEKKNQRHTKVSLKWRDSAFYHKKKLVALENWLKSKEIKIPSISELFPRSSPVISESKDIDILQNGGTDGTGLRGSNQEGVE
jgi:hypothetical protein